MEVSLHSFLTSVLDGVEWSAPYPSHFNSGERAPSAHWIRGWTGLRAGLDAVVCLLLLGIEPLSSNL